MTKNNRTLLSTAAIIIAAFFSTTVPAMAEVMDASDSKVVYIGRTKVDGPSVSFDWTGTYARISFKGSSLVLRASDTKKNYYNVWLDGSMKNEPDKVIAIAGQDTVITLFSKDELKARFGKDKKAAAAPHQVVLQKRTEGEQGVTTFKGFETDGEFLQASAPLSRVIEFIGDSYTCGFGSENSVATDPFTPETENQNKTYACITARYFGAEQIVIAHSGMGIARNFNGNVNDYYMHERYAQTFDSDKETKWDAKAYAVKPDITVIYLGTNDFSRGLQPAKRLFVKNYTLLLNEIKENYGEDHPILCVAPRNDIMMFDYIREVVSTCGLKNIHTMALTRSIHNDTDDLGASWHPNYNGHLKKAYAIIPYISTIMGWEMADNEIK